MDVHNTYKKLLNGFDGPQKILSQEKSSSAIVFYWGIKKKFPGLDVHNIELTPKRGGQIVRAAGTSAKILAKEGNYVTLRLPSKEIRLVRKECFATIGVIGNADHSNMTI